MAHRRPSTPVEVEVLTLSMKMEIRLQQLLPPAAAESGVAVGAGRFDCSPEDAALERSGDADHDHYQHLDLGLCQC